MSVASTPSFKVSGPNGQQVPVAAKRAAEAATIDADRDGVCSDAEIVDYMRAQDILDRDAVRANVPRITEEFKSHLTGVRPHTASMVGGKDYRSLAQLEARMHELADQHPDLCQLVSIAKTHEGRDVWALKVTSDAQGDTSARPGVVFTGTHHAREWMTPEVTLGLAEDMIEHAADPAMKQRLDNAETWVVPVANPDGFAYSQTSDNMWRKNRAPIYDPANPGGEPIEHGIDLNRNYWDGKPEHITMYRHADDTPGSTWDDYGASDDPSSDAYRGQVPASEPEVQGLMALEYGHANIKGVIDHHSYGGLLMRPWDDKPDEPDNVADYDEVAKRMLAAQDQPLEYTQTYNLYPTTGASVSCHHVNGRIGFGVEMGDSFQPPYSEFESQYKNMASADFAFLDWIIEKNAAPQGQAAPQAT